MTATVIGISAEDRGGRADLDRREYSVVYKVRTDNRSDGPGAIRTAFGIPNLGDMYVAGNDIDQAAVVVGKDVRQLDSPYTWEVEVTYSTDVPDRPIQSLEQTISNPLLEPAEISYGFQERRILVPGRYNDPIGPPSDKKWQAGIYAPNGELFDPQPEVEIAEPVMTIRKNVQTISGAVLMSLANSVNNDYWQGAEPRQLKLKAPQAVRKYHGAIGFYWEVTYTIAFRWETWDIQILNQGSYYWTNGAPTAVWSTTTLPTQKRTLSGEPRLVNLTTNGALNETSTPTFTRIRFFREVAFASLGII